MKHKLTQLIALIIIATFAWQSIVFADGSLRPLAMEECGSEILDNEILSGVELGDEIKDIDEIPLFRKALERVESEPTGLWGKTKRFIYDNENRRYHFRWAKGLAFPMQAHRVNGHCEILVDETYRNNSRLGKEIATNGITEDFIWHQTLSLNLALMDVLLFSSNKIDGNPAVAVGAAKILAGRVWMEQHSAGSLRGRFLGQNGDKGLADSLDMACANDHPGRFTQLYQMILPSASSGTHASSNGTKKKKMTNVAKTIAPISRSLRHLMPEINGGCRVPQVLSLFMEINPVDGRRLAREICDKVDPTYLTGNAACEWPRHELTYVEELALFKAMRDDPLNTEVANALTHCYARIVLMSAQKAIRRDIHKLAQLEEDDVKQIALLMLHKVLWSFNPEGGVRFITYLGESFRQPKLRSEIFRMAKQLSRGDVKIAPFEQYDGDSQEVLIPQETESPPDARLVTTERTQEIKELLARLTPRERLSMKLLYGIRFEGDPAKEWTLEEIGRLFGMSGEAVRQSLEKAKEKMRPIPESLDEVPELTDGDIYLATEIGLSPSSEFFPVLCEKKAVLLREREEVVRELIRKPRSELKLSPGDIAWISFDEEVKRSTGAQIRLTESSRKKKALSTDELDNYKKFKKLVAKLVYKRYKDEAERKKIVDDIVKLHSFRAPVKVAMLTDKTDPHHKIERRTVFFSEACKKQGLPWRAYGIDFNDEVFITPRSIDGRLNIEVTNSIGSQSEFPLYNAYWDGRAVLVSDEFSEFFLSDEILPVPARKLARRMAVRTIGHNYPFLTVFTKTDTKTKQKTVAEVSFDSAYAYVDKTGKIPRTCWLSAFRDDKGKGVMVHLNPDGPAVGKAYYVDGEFVPEPGPFLRSTKHSVTRVDSTRVFIERLRALSKIESSEVVVKRDIYFKKYTNKRTKEKKVLYSISPFGSIDGRWGLTGIGYVPGGEEESCYIKFIPSDNAFEIYPDEACKLEERKTRKFYDLDTQETFDEKEELRRRFDQFLCGDKMPNSIIVYANFGGRIKFKDKLTAEMGKRNAGRPYFVVFDTDRETGARTVSIYEVDKDLKPVNFAQCFDVDTAQRKVSPFKGAEKIRIQEMARRLGYCAKVEPATAEDKALILAELHAGRVARRELNETILSSILRPRAAGERIATKELIKGIMFQVRKRCALMWDCERPHRYLVRRLIEEGFDDAQVMTDGEHVWARNNGYILDLHPEGSAILLENARRLGDERCVILRDIPEERNGLYKGWTDIELTEMARREANNEEFYKGEVAALAQLAQYGLSSFLRGRVAEETERRGIDSNDLQKGIIEALEWTRQRLTDIQLGRIPQGANGNGRGSDERDPGIRMARETAARNAAIVAMAKKYEKPTGPEGRYFDRNTGTFRRVGEGGRNEGGNEGIYRTKVAAFFGKYKRDAKKLGGEQELKMMHDPVSMENLRQQVETFAGFPVSMDAFVRAMCEVFSPIRIHEDAKGITTFRPKKHITVASLFAPVIEDEGGKGEDLEELEVDTKAFALFRVEKRHETQLNLKRVEKDKMHGILLKILDGAIPRGKEGAIEALCEFLKEVDAEKAAQKRPGKKRKAEEDEEENPDDIERRRELAEQIVEDIYHEFEIIKIAKLGVLDNLDDDEALDEEISQGI